MIYKSSKRGGGEEGAADAEFRRGAAAAYEAAAILSLAYSPFAH
jgi:hypothetical protein